MKSSLTMTIVLILAIALIFFITLKNRQGVDGMPHFATASLKIKDTYTFAKNNPEQLNGVNCFCGCMEHSHDGRIHRRGLLDCFIKENGSYEKHASECDMCINDAFEVKSLLAQGLSKEGIKTKLYSKYVV